MTIERRPRGSGFYHYRKLRLVLWNGGRTWLAGVGLWPQKKAYVTALLKRLAKLGVHGLRPS